MSDRIMRTAARDLEVPDFRLEINGSEAPAHVRGAVETVEVDQLTNQANNFRVTLRDTPIEGTYHLLDSQLFDLGGRMRLFCGYTGSLQEMASGRIRSVRAEYTLAGLSFTVEGSDDAYEFLTAKSGSQVFRDRRDSEIAAEIARTAGLAARVDKTAAKTPSKTKMAGISYLRFISKMAAENGFTFRLAGRELRFERQRPNPPADTILSWEVEVTSFASTVSTWSTVSEVEVRGWDQRRKQEVVGRAGAGDELAPLGKGPSASVLTQRIAGRVQRVVADRSVSSVGEAALRARSLLSDASDGLVEAEAETLGNPGLAAGTVVEMAGFNSRVSGLYFVVQANHRIDTDGYVTRLKLRRNTL